MSVKFILIFWIAYHPPFTAVEFDSQRACLEAGRVVKERRDNANFAFVCVPKYLPDGRG